MIATLLLAAALWPSESEHHEVAATVGLGVEEQQQILLVSWTGRRRWGAWFRLDDAARNYTPETVLEITASSVGVAWRPLQRLTAGLGYGEKRTTTAAGPEDRRETENGITAVGAWTFPVNKIVGVMVSATLGVGGFGAGAGVTFYFD